MNPGKPFNSLVFRKYISSITKLAEEYLYISGASDDKYRKGLTLLEIYQRAGLENLYAKKEREVSAYMNGKNKINSSFFQNKIWHSEIMFNYLNKNINNEKSLNAITEYQQYLNLYFIHAYANNLGKYHAYNYNFSLTDSYFKKYFKLIGKKYLDDVEKLYTGEELQIFRLIKNDIDLSREDIDSITIGKMSDLVFECRDLLSYNMQYYFLARLNNFCLVMNAKGKPGYKKILFENYKFIFDSGLYFSDGRSTITISEYTGILLSALKVKEFDWAEKFINTCETNNYMKNPDNISLYGL